MAETSDELYAHLWKRRWEIIHRIKLSVLYHHKRERFFDAVDKFILASTAFSASAAFALVLKQLSSDVGLYVSALTAALAMISMAYTPSLKAKQHANLAADFKRLLAECEKAGERWSEEECNHFASRTIELEAGEPAQLGALVVQCENEIAVAVGKPENVRRLPWWKTRLMHFINFDVTGLQADLRKPV